MFRNYFKIAIRNIMKQKGYSLINILGLALGITCSILLMLWIADELSYDRFHQDGERIYRILEHQEYTSQNMEVAVTPGPMVPAMKEVFPEIEEAVRFTHVYGRQFRIEDQVFSEMLGGHVDREFLDVFTFPRVAGKANCLDDIDAIVLTVSSAEKMFGASDPVGETVILANDIKVVSAVIEDVPENSHVDFDYLLPISDLGRAENNYLEEWGSNSLRSYVKLRSGVDEKDFEKKIGEFIKQNNEGSSATLYLQSLYDIHLHSVGMVADLGGMGDIRYIIIFSVVCAFILIISCINFISLTTARYSKRAREVGMRKVLGSLRSQLISQFLSESIFMVLIALIIALMFTEIALPWFNSFTGKSLNLLGSLHFLSLAGMILAAVFIGFLSGIYPAFLLSSFKPVSVLKSENIKGQKGGLFRKILVVLQWTLSIILIISTMILFQQLRYMQNKKLGYDKDQILYTDFTNAGNFDEVKRELITLSGVENVSAVMALPHSIMNSTSGAHWDGKSEDDTFLIHYNFVETDFIETFNIKLKEGVSFNDAHLPEGKTAYVLNQETIKKMGIENPIGKNFSVWGMDGEIVGVTENFHFKSLHNPVEPMLMFQIPEYYNFITVRVNSTNFSSIIPQLEEVAQKFTPDRKVSFHFFDDKFDAMYKAEEEMSTILKLFTILAIVIASLGLFGLSAYLTELRIKEIGIRKVLGANVLNIVVNLSKDFTQWIVIANAIALPLSYLMLRKILENFAYHIDLKPYTFIATFIVSLIIGIVTVTSQTIKAAVSNPIKALKSE